MEGTIIKSHTLKYENDHIYASGVVNLDNFENNLIIARLCDKTMTIKGNNLNVEDLNIKTGVMVISGTLTSLSYHHKQEKLSLTKKFFK
jgi:hypothetical protein